MNPKRAPSDSGKRSYYRPPHRMRNHAAAHADAAAANVPVILDHPMVPANAPDLVADQPTLDALIDTLREAGVFAYDTEFIGEQSFYPKFCVIQVATAGRVTLIDALAGLDLSRFWALLADGSVQKIVHAGRQDFEPVMRFLGKPPRNIFDTQIAAGLAGDPPPPPEVITEEIDAEAERDDETNTDTNDDAGAEAQTDDAAASDEPIYPASLGALVEHYTGGDLGHGLKFSQWDHRPLTDVQKQYAANDVRYLPLLRQVLIERIDALGHAEALREELAALEEPALYRFDPLSQKLKAKGVGGLSRRKHALLRELLLWRARVAESEDVPPRLLIKDDVLVTLATTPIERASDLLSIKGLPRPVREHFGQGLLEAIAAGKTAPLPPKQPRLPRLMRAQEKRVDRLCEAMRARCRSQGIAPGLAMTKRDVIAYVRQTTPTPGSTRGRSGDQGSGVGDPGADGIPDTTSVGGSAEETLEETSGGGGGGGGGVLLRGWRGRLFGDLLRGSQR